MTLKEKFEEATGRDFERAVSPVIGVILMVAITVILAAVIGAFVMGLGNNVNQNAQAGISFDQINDTYVDVQLTSLGNVNDASSIEVKGCSNYAGGDGTGNFTSVGDIITTWSCDNGDKITVIAEYDGKTNVVATHKVN